MGGGGGGGGGKRWALGAFQIRVWSRRWVGGGGGGLNVGHWVHFRKGMEEGLGRGGGGVNKKSCNLYEVGR